MLTATLVIGVLSGIVACAGFIARRDWVMAAVVCSLTLWLAARWLLR